MEEKKTVLFVDDEEDIRLMVSVCLEDEGYRVLTAPDVPQALSLAFSEFPDLVISDVMMPGESGWALCEKLKADTSTAKIPFVFLTVMDEETRGMELGATAFLSKPFEDGELRATVNGILNTPDSRVLLEAALTDLREKRVSEAMQGFVEVIKSDPGSAPATWSRYYAAQIYAKAGEPAKAKEQFTGILSQDANFYRAHNHLGVLLIEEGESEKAKQHLQRSLSINDNQPDIRSRLAALQEQVRPSIIPTD